MSTEIQRQEEIARQTYKAQKSFLHKYGLSVLPSHKDSSLQARAFYADPEAVEAYKANGREQVRVGLLVPDHMTPISKGGSNYIDNLTPACRSCNSSKGDKSVEEYLDYLKRQSASLDTISKEVDLSVT